MVEIGNKAIRAGLARVSASVTATAQVHTELAAAAYGAAASRPAPPAPGQAPTTGGRAGS